jgi:hypothetical protein
MVILMERRMLRLPDGAKFFQADSLVEKSPLLDSFPVLRIRRN